MTDLVIGQTMRHVRTGRTGQVVALASIRATPAHGGNQRLVRLQFDGERADMNWYLESGLTTETVRDDG